MDQVIRSDDACDRCVYGQCAGIKRKPCSTCDHNMVIGCRCDTVSYGTPCIYFKERDERNDIQKGDR